LGSKIAENEKVLSHLSGASTELQAWSSDARDFLDDVGPRILKLRSQLDLYQSTPVAVDQMERSVSIGLRFGNVIAKPSDCPIPPDLAGNAVAGILAGKDGSDPANVLHAPQLHARLAKQLADHGLQLLEPLRDDWFALSCGVVAEVGGNPGKWFGVLAAPPVDDCDGFCQFGLTAFSVLLPNRDCV